MFMRDISNCENWFFSRLERILTIDALADEVNAQSHPVILSMPIPNSVVRHRAVAAQIEIPFEWCERQVVRDNPVVERFKIVLALSPSDDLADLVLRPTHRDREVTCRGSMYLIKQKTWSGGSGGKGSFRDCS